jgi:hypothetical protein
MPAIIVSPSNFLYLPWICHLELPRVSSRSPHISQGSPCFSLKSPYISPATFCSALDFSSVITDLHIFPSCAILDLSQFSCIFSESLCIFIDLSVFSLDFSSRMSLYLFWISLSLQRISLYLPRILLFFSSIRSQFLISLCFL